MSISPSDFRIISGGQTGADRAALDWAIANGVEHRGWCPKGRRAEDGPIPDRYRLNETPLANYLQRTEWNVRDADGTVVFTMVESLDGGSKRTVEFARKYGRPCLHMHPRVHAKYLSIFLKSHMIQGLNVAGKRESSAPGINQYVCDTLSEAYRILRAE